MRAGIGASSTSYPDGVMRLTRTLPAAASGSMVAAYDRYGSPVRAATPGATTPAPPSDVSTPASTRSNSRVLSAAARIRVVATVHEPPMAGSVTSTPRVAPMASALRIVSGAVAGAIVRRITWPSPAASMSLSAFSRTYSSLPLTTAGLLVRSRRPSAPMRSPPDAGSGTGLVRTTMRTSCWTSPPRSAALAEQCPCDDQALDLLRPLVQLGDLRVTHHPLDRELIDIAITAQDLDGVGRDPHGVVTGHEFTHGRPSTRVRGTRVDLDACLVQQLARGLGSRVHVGQHRADHLEVADALSELPAVPGIRRCDLEGTLRDADGLRGDPRPAAIERAHRDIEPVALLTQEVRGRHADLVEGELRGRAATKSHLVFDPGDGKSVRRDLQDESGQAAMPVRLRVGDGEDDEQVGDRPVADEALRA